MTVLSNASTTQVMTNRRLYESKVEPIVTQTELARSTPNLQCENEALPESETRHLDEADLRSIESKKTAPNGVGTAFHNVLRPITLEVENWFFALPVQETVIIGRKSVSHGNYHLDVDLDFFRALGKGVSRQHLAIIRKDMLVYVSDMNTINGTWLNGQKLTSTDERLLRDGDQLRLGQLRIRIHFR